MIKWLKNYIAEWKSFLSDNIIYVLISIGLIFIAFVANVIM